MLTSTFKDAKSTSGSMHTKFAMWISLAFTQTQHMITVYTYLLWSLAPSSGHNEIFFFWKASIKGDNHITNNTAIICCACANAEDICMAIYVLYNVSRRHLAVDFINVHKYFLRLNRKGGGTFTKASFSNIYFLESAISWDITFFTKSPFFLNIALVFYIIRKQVEVGFT